MIGTVTTAAMIVGSVVFVTAPAAAGFSASGVVRDLSDTILASFAFNDVDDSLTICDQLDDGRRAFGEVRSLHGEEGPILEFTGIDDTADGNCVVVGKDLVEGTTLTVGVRMQWSDGSSASFSAGAWAIA